MTTDRPRRPGPTTEQLFALIVYANGHGRSWKSQLRNDWMTGRVTGDLQQIRNQFGPSWLARFKLPIVNMVKTGAVIDA